MVRPTPVAILLTGIVAQPMRISGGMDANQWTAVRGNLHPKCPERV